MPPTDRTVTSFPKAAYITSITHDRITLSNGYYIEATHEQDCCENNYADFKSLSDTSITDSPLYSISFSKWEGGIRINNYAVNCYSLQNGYYSTEITFTLRDKKGKEIISYAGNCKMDDSY